MSEAELIKQAYEKLVARNPDATFFQSKTFGEFQEKIPYRGKVILLRGIGSTCLAVKMRLPFGFCWLWIPYGPLGYDGEILRALEKIAGEEKALFARIEPPMHWSEYNKIFRSSKMTAGHDRFTPEHSLVLDLEKTGQELLLQMKPKGRYNIKIGEKNITAKKYDFFEKIPKKDFLTFCGLLKKTAQRDGFGIHPTFFYETLLKTFGPEKMSSLFLAYFKEKVVGGIIIIYYKDTATYYYGASDYEHRNLMAPYTLQWEAIREAKKRGMKYYDFLGIAPPESKNHAWSGVTGFKKKFGGREVVYPPAFDIIYKPLLYKAYRSAKKLRRA